jgi:peptide deformylase
MALRKLVFEGDAILRKTSKEVTNFGHRTQVLLDDMWDTMREYDGIGLAAPQVGVLRRIVVIDVLPPEVAAPDAQEPEGAQPEAEASAVRQPASVQAKSGSDAKQESAHAEVAESSFGRYELLNPVILESEGEMCEEEGCLSLPGVVGRVLRPARVKVQAFDRNGKTIIVEGTGLLAKALSHEIDHLNGILFTDIAESVREPDR